jgi:rhamnosyltransferase
MDCSIIIRTYNEGKYIGELLEIINCQEYDDGFEVIIVDSGSYDQTLNIAREYGCIIKHINKNEFTFGRSLNIGCDSANGKYLVIISGHCVPFDKYWLINIIKPLKNGCSYVYGKQIGRDTTKFSECVLFSKYYCDDSRIPQEGYFCNNANAAILKNVWDIYRFNEDITGCEDMLLAKQLVDNGMFIGYASDSVVYHIHDENWEKIRIRYEREALALQKIMPEVQLNIKDMLHYIFVGIVKDSNIAIRKKVFFREIYSIVMFRIMQYYGAYKGNHIHRKLSQSMKIRYFYPRVTSLDVSVKDLKDKYIK